MKCPICNHTNFQKFISVKDHLVSNETFDLVACSDCNFVFTKDAPDKENIGKYYESKDYISHTNDNKGLINRIYQLIRNFSVSRKLNLVKRFSFQKNGYLLDYGCGTGNFLHYAKSKNWRVEGIEPDSNAQKKAKELINQPVYSPEYLSNFENNKFDVITLWHVLEHVHDLTETLIQFKRVLKKEGLLVIAVPNKNSFDSKFYKEFWAAYDVPRHLYHFTPDTLNKLLSEKNFEKLKIFPMWFDSFYVSLLSDKYKNGGLNLFRPFLIGLISNIKSIIKPGTCSSQIYFYRAKIS